MQLHLKEQRGGLCQVNQNPCLWSTIVKKTEKLHQAVISYAWIYTVVPLLNYSLWSLFTKPVEDESGLCSHVIGRRKVRDTMERKRGGDKQAFLGEKIRKHKTEERKERRQSEETGRYVDSLQKCNTSNATPFLHPPCNHFQHIKFGLTTIAELQY